MRLPHSSGDSTVRPSATARVAGRKRLLAKAIAGSGLTQNAWPGIAKSPSSRPAQSRANRESGRGRVRCPRKGGMFANAPEISGLVCSDCPIAVSDRPVRPGLTQALRYCVGGQYPHRPRRGRKDPAWSALPPCTRRATPARGSRFPLRARIQRGPTHPRGPRGFLLCPRRRG